MDEKNGNAEMNEVRHRLHMLWAQKLLSIQMLGDQIAKEEGYPHSEMDAICYYLFDKRGLDPARVRVLSADALGMLLSKELKGWVRPEPHRHVEAATDGKPGTAYAASLAVLEAQAQLDCRTERFGDEIAEREGYGSKDGREALELYLCRTFGYRPDEVASWSMETIGNLLAPEMEAWRSPSGRPRATSSHGGATKGVRVRGRRKSAAEG